MPSASSSRKAREAKAAALRAQVEAAERRRKVAIVLSSVAAVLVVVAGIGLAFQNARSTVTVSTTPSALSNGALLVGEADAPVTVKIYEDFYCPVCGQFETAYGDVLESYVESGDVKVEYHMISILDSYDPTDSDYSTRAAAAAAAVYNADPTKFEAFRELLFENQPEEGVEVLSDAQLLKYAVQAGVTEADVKAAITGQTYADWVTALTDQASQDGVTGTPTVLVNGEDIGDWTSSDTLSPMVEAALAG